MVRGLARGWSQADEVRRLFPAFALAVTLAAAIIDPSSAGDTVLAAVPVVAFAAWAYVPGLPLEALTVAVLVPVVVAQRSGALEPLLFDASLLALVVARWSRSPRAAIALGVLAAASPVAVALIQEPSKIAVGIWIVGIVFPWAIGRVAARQSQLAAQLEGTRRELAEQALLAERRRIARDVHDLVGHGLAAVMLQVTSARHVLRRDPDAAEEALRSAEEVGRRSMQELRRTVTLLRSDEDGARMPVPSASEVSTLVDQARAAGLAVELRLRGDLSSISAAVGLALYRIVQEALANAGRHAPRARTVVAVAVAEEDVSLAVETSGPVAAPGDAGEPERQRYGLIGMRERATALGGEFSAGPTADGWRVQCRVPLGVDDET